MVILDIHAEDITDEDALMVIDAIQDITGDIEYGISKEK